MSIAAKILVEDRKCAFNLERICIEMSVSAPVIVGQTDDPADIYENLTVRILAEDPDNDDHQEIGKLNGYIFRFDKMNPECSMDIFHEAIDAIDQATYDFYPALEQLVKDGFYLDLVTRPVIFLNTMEILPECRKQQVGLRVTKWIMGTLSGIVIIHPHPIIHREDLEANRVSDSETKKGIKALRKYWGSLGFVRIGRTPFYWMDASVESNFSNT